MIMHFFFNNMVIMIMHFFFNNMVIMINMHFFFKQCLSWLCFFFKYQYGFHDYADTKQKRTKLIVAGLDTPVSSTNKTDHDINEILSKVALNTITLIIQNIPDDKLKRW
jgi:Na+/phosphate symporter